MKCIQIQTTTPDEKTTNLIRDELLNTRLASCVQVAGPLKSTYWWKGSLENAEEWLMIIKTAGKNFAVIEKTIKRLHPYETPEIIALEICNGSKDYLDWIKNETRGFKK